ncbi:hypothetical protein FOZ60_006791 [Perkinsus olseni]|uniref:EF-hand domain-containing protein n=1 Tax=Perkinsus olseni TaxID=32597 RepID=A0A7J6NMT0_PEROL|nr:hypothetical protein FOZ60_006791 [Perkinsus olseni]
MRGSQSAGGLTAMKMRMDGVTSKYLIDAARGPRNPQSGNPREVRRNVIRYGSEVNRSSMTEVERARVKGAFKSLDLDGDGLLSEADLAESIRMDGLEVDDRTLLSMMWEVSELRPVSGFEIDLDLNRPRLSLRDVELLYVRGKKDTTARHPRRLFVYFLYRMLDPRAVEFGRRTPRSFQRTSTEIQGSGKAAASYHPPSMRRKAHTSRITGDDVFSFLYPIMSAEELKNAREKYFTYCMEIRQHDHEERLLAHLKVEPTPPVEVLQATSQGRRNAVAAEVPTSREKETPAGGARQFSRPKVKIKVEGENINSGPVVRLIRQLAAKHSISLSEMEQIHSDFSKYDTDHSGTISKEEFLALLRKVLRVSGDEVEAGRLDRAWANVRSKSKGEASLEDFTIWYKGNFRAAGGSSGSSGAESKGMDKVLGLAMRTPWSHDNVKDVAGWHSARRSKTGVPTRGSLRPSESSPLETTRRRVAALIKQQRGRQLAGGGGDPS